MGAAAPAIGLGMSVVGKLAGGVEANRAARANAAIDEQNALLTLLGGEQESLQTRKDERMQAGDMLAAMGGGGLEIGSGSAADVIAESAYQRELEILNIRTKAAGDANNLYQAARDKRAAGKSALIQSVFSAGASAISGISDIRAARVASAQTAKEQGYILGGGNQANLVAGEHPPRVPQMRLKSRPW